jgi:hypothetical protein
MDGLAAKEAVLDTLQESIQSSFDAYSLPMGPHPLTLSNILEALVPKHLVKWVIHVMDLVNMDRVLWSLLSLR